MRALFVAAFLFALTTPAQALLCTPILGCACTVTASDLDFGALDPLSGAQIAVGEVSVDCTGVIDVAPSVVTTLNAGQWGAISARKLRDASGNLLNYNIYTNAQHSIVWGDGTGGSASVSISGGLVTLGHWTVSRSMYGRVTPTAATKPGAYSDTVMVRIVW